MLTHDDLIKLGNALGYKMTKGLCQGFTCMYAQAALLGDTKSFEDRLRLIESYNDNTFPTKLVNAIKAIKQEIVASASRKQALVILSDHDRALLEIVAFFDCIVLYLSPSKYFALFDNTYLTQTALSNIHEFTRANNETLAIVLHKMYVGVRTDWICFFKALSLHLAQTSIPLPLLISNMRHSVYAIYDPKKNCWRYSDTNLLGCMNMEYHQECSSEWLVDCLQTMYHNNHVVFALNITMIAYESHLQQEPTLQAQLLAFSQKFPIQKQYFQHTEKNGCNLLHLACLEDYLEVMQQLIDDGFNVNQKNHDGARPVDFAVLHGSLSALKLLHRAGADLTAINLQCGSLTSIAVRGNHVPILQYLLQCGLDFNLTYDSDMNLAHMAAFMNRVDALRFLYQNNPLCILHADANGETPAYYAAQRGNLEALEFLHQCKVDFNHVTSNGATPFFPAAEDNNYLVIKRLAAYGGDPEKKARHGNTAMHIAARAGSTQAIEALYACGADLNSQDDYGNTPVIVAAQYGRFDAIAALHRLGADINKMDHHGISAAYTAAEYGYLNTLKILRQLGGNFHQTPDNTATPAFIAAQNGYRDIVDFLLDLESTFTQAFVSRRDLLLEFAQHESTLVQRRMVKTIARRLAEGDLDDKIKLLPVDIAEIMGHHEIVLTLKRRLQSRQQALAQVTLANVSLFNNLHINALPLPVVANTQP